MPNIEIDTQHLADLARIELSQKELEQMDQQIESIIAYVSKLVLVDTKNIPPSVYMTDALNVFRDDSSLPCDTETRKRCIDAFPEHVGDALQVQGVFEERTE